MIRKFFEENRMIVLAVAFVLLIFIFSSPNVNYLSKKNCVPGDPRVSILIKNFLGLPVNAQTCNWTTSFSCVNTIPVAKGGPVGVKNLTTFSWPSLGNPCGGDMYNLSVTGPGGLTFSGLTSTTFGMYLNPGAAYTWTVSASVNYLDPYTGICTGGGTYTATPASPGPQAFTTPGCVPLVTLEANGSTGSITIPTGTAATLTWTSINADSCTASGGWSGAKAVNGSESTGNLSSSQIYNIACVNGTGSATSSVAVNVANTCIYPQIFDWSPGYSWPAGSYNQAYTFTVSPNADYSSPLSPAPISGISSSATNYSWSGPPGQSPLFVGQTYYWETTANFYTYSGGLVQATGGTAYASSVYDGYSAASATDGSTATVWGSSPTASSTTQWLAIKLPSALPITSVKTYPDASLPTTNFKNFSIQGSNDSTNGANGTWTTLASGLNTSNVAQWDTFNFSNPTVYLWYRLTGPSQFAVLGKGGNAYITDAAEVQLYYNSGGSSSTTYKTSTLSCVLPPTTPTLSQGTTQCNAAGLNWTASTGATGYVVFKNNVSIATTTALAYTDYGVSQNSSYSYYVQAYNSAGNANSNTISVNTPYCPPTVYLTCNGQHGNITVPAGASCNLAWTTSGGSATSCTASGGWSGSKSTSGGSETSAPITVSPTVFTLTCVGPGGSSAPLDSVTVNTSGYLPPTWIEIHP